MQVHDAIAVVNGLVTYPGVRVTARDITHRFQGMMAVRVTFDKMHRSDDWPIPPSEITYDAYTDHHLCADDYSTNTQLVGAVIDIVMRVFEHEVREFTKRFMGEEHGWVAPFHPHTTPGRKAWQLKTGAPMERDLMYGTVGES